MTIGFFHGLTLAAAEGRLRVIKELIDEHHNKLDQAVADREAAIHLAQQELVTLRNLKFTN